MSRQPAVPSQQPQMLATRPVDTLRALLEKSKDQIRMALPRHMTPERMIRMAVTAFLRTPALQECSPLSVVGGVIQAAELGLELSGPLGQAYLVPYWNKHTQQKEAQFQIGYRGLMDLAYRSNRIATISAHAVYPNDQFRFAYGTRPFLHHIPACEPAAEYRPEDVIYVYAVVSFRNGAADFEVMSRPQIEAHRLRYSKQKTQDGPWLTAWQEMAQKTLIRKLIKRCPVSVEIQTAVGLDEQAEADIPQGLGMDLMPMVPTRIAASPSRTDQVAAKLGVPAGTAPEPEAPALPPTDETTADTDDSQRAAAAPPATAPTPDEIEQPRSTDRADRRRGQPGRAAS